MKQEILNVGAFMVCIQLDGKMEEEEEEEGNEGNWSLRKQSLHFITKKQDHMADDAFCSYFQSP